MDNLIAATNNIINVENNFERRNYNNNRKKNNVKFNKRDFPTL